MKRLQFKPIFLSVTTFGLITYAICVVFDLIFPQWAMNGVWGVLLPGFTWLSWGSFFLGIFWMIVYGLYTAAIFVPIYNNFNKQSTQPI